MNKKQEIGGVAVDSQADGGATLCLGRHTISIIAIRPTAQTRPSDTAHYKDTIVKGKLLPGSPGIPLSTT